MEWLQVARRDGMGRNTLGRGIRSDARIGRSVISDQAPRGPAPLRARGAAC
jgi:hypothetical protein